MALDNLTIALDGEVHLEQFSRTIRSFYHLVKALSEEIGKPDLDWIIDDLQVSSAIATARAPSDPQAAEQVVNAYADIGSAFQSNTAPRQVYSPRVRTASARVVSIRDERITAIRFETPVRESIVRISPGQVIAFPTSTFRAVIPALESAHPEPLIFVPAPSLGAIQGRVQVLSNRGGLRFTLYDLLYDKAIGCYVSEGQQELLRDIWGKIAIIEGMITRDPVNGRPLSIRQISNITPLPEPYTRREYQEARGAAPSLTGLSPEEAVRRVRDAQ
jgi:hypothetical protein